eukprot:SAG11_NODE_9289_length_925_cov_1.237288_3_plen_44_part_01
MAVVFCPGRSGGGSRKERPAGKIATGTGTGTETEAGTGTGTGTE